MGSLNSSPPAPPPEIIYVPQTSPIVAPEAAGPSAEELAGQVRRENLLRRGRGRFGTIQTSFRGLLALALPGSQRKTLLGE